VARLEFNCINNIAEYEALLLGLRMLKAMGIRRAVLKSDS
jgi:ribonuclease HI